MPGINLDMKEKKTIFFNRSKKETHSCDNGFKKLTKRLKNHYKVLINKNELSIDGLTNSSLIVFGNSQEQFSIKELDELKVWLEGGGRALFLLNSNVKQSNLSEFLTRYGIDIQINNSVLRATNFKYLHPKEVFISDGILIPDIIKKKEASIILTTNKLTNASKHIPKAVNDTNNFEIVFPYGSSFTVSRPSRPLMTSGMHSHPPNTPICATWEAETTGTYEGQRGRFVVLGSTDIFADDWIECEENIKLCDMLFGWLLNLIDLDLASFKTSTAVVESPSYVSSVDLLSHTLKPCLQDTERIPTNITELFQLKPFHISLGSTSLILNLYSELHLPHEPLGLISPQFDCPLPRLLGATFPPSMKDPCAPALDLFDLDELMAPPDVCLAQLTNKCTGGADDLEYYVHEAGIKLQVEDIDKGAKSILFEIFKTISHYKRAIISH